MTLRQRLAKKLEIQKLLTVPPLIIYTFHYLNQGLPVFLRNMSVYLFRLEYVNFKQAAQDYITSVCYNQPAISSKKAS